MALGNNTYVHNYRGTDQLYIAEVLTDNNESGEGYTTGTPYKLAPLGSVSKTTEASQSTVYYDNVPAYTISAEGADTITVGIPAISLANLAAITGKDYDTVTGALIDGEGAAKEYALGFRIGTEAGKYQWYWFLKGTFAIPDVSSATIDAGTDSQGMELNYTAISTQHRFTKTSKPARSVVVDDRDGLANTANWFNAVVTPDTVA